MAINKANILQITDFVGRYAIAQNEFLDDNSLEIIHELEYNLFIDLLGAELYNEFVDDLVDGVPQTQKWLNFLNGATYTDCYGCVRNYLGVKSFLVPLVYSEFIQSSKNFNSNLGLVTPKSENSNKTSEFDIRQKVYKSHNEGVRYYDECYLFLYTYDADYPNFYDFFKKKTVKGFYNKITTR